MQNKTEQLLKEKARMFSDRITEARLACKRFPNCEGCQTDCGAEFLVGLSDAEQEIEKIKGLAEETSHIMIEAEREELKQKLQQLVKETPSCVDCEYCLGDEEGNSHCSLTEQQHIDSVLCPKDKFVNVLHKKLEELLKEEKEAKA